MSIVAHDLIERSKNRGWRRIDFHLKIIPAAYEGNQQSGIETVSSDVTNRNAHPAVGQMTIIVVVSANLCRSVGFFQSDASNPVKNCRSEAWLFESHGHA